MSGYVNIRTTQPKARKIHRCIWCGEDIPIEEQHVYDVGRYDGHLQHNRWHSECYASAGELWDEMDGEFEPYSNERGGGPPE